MVLELKFHNKENPNGVPSKLTRIDSEISRRIVEIAHDSLGRRISLEKSKKEASKPLYLSRYE